MNLRVILVQGPCWSLYSSNFSIYAAEVSTNILILKQGWGEIQNVHIFIIKLYVDIVQTSSYVPWILKIKIQVQQNRESVSHERA